MAAKGGRRRKGKESGAEVENFVYRRSRRLESHKIIGKRLRASARDTRREKKEKREMGE